MVEHEDEQTLDTWDGEDAAPLQWPPRNGKEALLEGILSFVKVDVPLSIVSIVEMQVLAAPKNRYVQEEVRVNCRGPSSNFRWSLQSPNPHVIASFTLRAFGTSAPT